jgi:hypothetical protein
MRHFRLQLPRWRLCHGSHGWPIAPAAVTAEKTAPPRGMVSAPFCAEGRVRRFTARLGFWPFFGANCASRLAARCRDNAYR